MKMSFYASAVSVHLNPIQEIHWISRVSRLSRSFHIFRSSFDPSHAGGKWWLVEPMAKAAVAAGANGLMIEVHNNPEMALCDGSQSLKPAKYDALLKQVAEIAKVVGKTF